MTGPAETHLETLEVLERVVAAAHVQETKGPALRREHGGARLAAHLLRQLRRELRVCTSADGWGCRRALQIDT